MWKSLFIIWIVWGENRVLMDELELLLSQKVKIGFWFLIWDCVKYLKEVVEVLRFLFCSDLFFYYLGYFLGRYVWDVGNELR